MCTVYSVTCIVGWLSEGGHRTRLLFIIVTLERLPSNFLSFCLRLFFDFIERFLCTKSRSSLPLSCLNSHFPSLPFFSPILPKKWQNEAHLQGRKTCPWGPHSHRLLTIINLQDLKQEKFVIDVEPSETVRLFPSPQLPSVIECGAHLFRFARSR